MHLKDKNILLGITGSIAAYKAAFFIRLLKKEGANVKVVSTQSGLDFITPLTLSTLSENPVLSEFVKNKQGEWVNHVELGLWADLVIIAPASTNTIAKMANGICDNLLLACYLSARCPVMVAPAMDLDMYLHPSTQQNLTTLKKYGNTIIDPEEGPLASGLIGKGRMAEPEHLLGALAQFFSSDGKKALPLKGKTVLVTAGPTYEPIDPVRFIGNHSSGKMGIAIAESLARQGAEVIAICGPGTVSTKEEKIKRIDIGNSDEMYDAVMETIPMTDINIFAAAVADYKPSEVHVQKVKKQQENLSIALIKTHDIAQASGAMKKKNQINIGFALETENEKENAIHKLSKKNFDAIVLNSLNDKGAGFGHDTNKISILDNHNNYLKFELKQKYEVANDIVDFIIKKLNEKSI